MRDNQDYITQNIRIVKDIIITKLYPLYKISENQQPACFTIIGTQFNGRGTQLESQHKQKN
jgi:hypothetical protein